MSAAERPLVAHTGYTTRDARTVPLFCARRDCPDCHDEAGCRLYGPCSTCDGSHDVESFVLADELTDLEARYLQLHDIDAWLVYTAEVDSDACGCTDDDCSRCVDGRVMMPPCETCGATPSGCRCKAREGRAA